MYELDDEGNECRGRTRVVVVRLGEVRCGAGCATSGSGAACAVCTARRLAVSPPACLIPWSYVITIQALSEFKDLKVTGFKRT